MPISAHHSGFMSGVVFVLALCAAALVSCTALAVEVEGIDLPDSVKMTSGPELVLNGAGVRTQVFFKIYVSALYLPARNSDGEAVLSKDQPRRLTLHFLRDISPDEFTKSTNSALEDTLTPQERRPLEARLEQFNAMLATLREVRKGMEIAIDYVPRLGTTVRVDGKAHDRIPGVDFNQALMRIWLGDKPRDPQLKKAMLGVS